MPHALQGVLILIAAGVSAAFVPSPAPVLGRRIHLSGRPVRFGKCCADASHATEAAACSGPPASQFWEWRYNSRIHYTQAGDTGPPIVLLTGFGVGGFHYARNIEVLGKAHRVWTMDILGQGQSWPQVSLHAVAHSWSLPCLTNCKTLARRQTQHRVAAIPKAAFNGVLGPTPPQTQMPQT